MKGDERRAKIIQMLQRSSDPVSGKKLAETFAVSRQVIVQDIARLRAEYPEITSTTFGYVLVGDSKISRVFKVIHTEEQVEEELNLIVDLGGSIEDVFVYHRVYGTMRGTLNIRSRRDVQRFMQNLRSGKSTLLMKVTSGYHYHTVSADSEEDLDLIQKHLNEKGFLAELQDYEPVNFWDEEADKQE